jgi:hypothetical protein
MRAARKPQITVAYETLRAAVDRLNDKVSAAAVEAERPASELIRKGEDGRAMHAGVYLLWRSIQASNVSWFTPRIVKDACDDGGWLHILSEQIDPSNGFELTKRQREALAKRVEAVERGLAR